MWPFKKAENPIPSTTDDKFLIQIDNYKSESELKKVLKKTGAIEIILKEKNNIK